MFLFKSRFSGLAAALPTRNTIERGRAAVIDGVNAAAAAVERLDDAVLAAPRHASGHGNRRVAITVAAVAVTAVAATAAYVWWRSRNDATNEQDETTMPPASPPMRAEPVATWSAPAPVEPAPAESWPPAPWPAPVVAPAPEPVASSIAPEPARAESAVALPANEVTLASTPVAASSAPDTATAEPAAAPTNPWGAPAPSLVDAIATPAAPAAAPVAADSIPAWLAPSSLRTALTTTPSVTESVGPLVARAEDMPAESTPVSSMPVEAAASLDVWEPSQAARVDEQTVAQADAELQAERDAEPEPTAEVPAPSTPPAVPAPSAPPADDFQYSTRRAPTHAAPSPFGRQFAAPAVRTVLPARRSGLP